MNAKVKRRVAIAVSCLPLDSARPCFAIPLFEVEGRFPYIMRYDAFGSKITGFDLLDENVSEAVKLRFKRSVRQGEPPLLAYLDGFSAPIVGSHSELAAWARELDLDRLPASLAVQISEMLLSDEAQIIARSRLGAILKSEGEATLYAYLSSSATSKLWFELSFSTKDNVTRDRMPSSLSNLRVSVRPAEPSQVIVHGIDHRVYPDFDVDKFIRACQVEIQQYVSDNQQVSVEQPASREMINPEELRSALNRFLGPDGRIGERSYRWLTEVVNKMERNALDRLFNPLTPSQAYGISYIALGSAKGQMTRAELILTFLHGEDFIRAYEKVYSFAGWPRHLRAALESSRNEIEKSYPGLIETVERSRGL